MYTQNNQHERDIGFECGMRAKMFEDIVVKFKVKRFYHHFRNNNNNKKKIGKLNSYPSKYNILMLSMIQRRDAQITREKKTEDPESSGFRERKMMTADEKRVLRGIFRCYELNN
ncbi:hypothetical protein GQX74_014453 [Glossina fuscipes]|nr:hypothetical protein GQX74_014453 [Glossina fuscipes]